MEFLQAPANGGQGGLSENLPLIIAFVVIIILSIFMRRRRGARTNLEVAVGLVSDVRYNLKVINVFSTTTPSFKKLKTGNWQKNSAKIEFLDPQLQSYITTAFNLAMEYNERLVQAKKQKSSGYMLGIDTSKLGDALTRSEDGLRTWIKENFRTELYNRPRRGLFG